MRHLLDDGIFSAVKVGSLESREQNAFRRQEKIIFHHFGRRIPTSVAIKAPCRQAVVQKITEAVAEDFRFLS